MLNVSKFPLLRPKESLEIKLAKNAIKGDSNAYTEIIKLYKSDLYKIAYSYVKDENKALDIPKFVVVENYALKQQDKNYTKRGTWAFDIPTKVNKELKEEIKIEDIENEYVKLESAIITPFELRIIVTYKNAVWNDYDVNIFDEVIKLGE